MTQHTPGPWFAHNIGLGPNGEGPFTYPLGNDPDKAAANARLIAAAPDLLDMCERLLGFALFYGEPTAIAAGDGMINAAKALIAQAKGGAA
jgi:hypothetical protein